MEDSKTIQQLIEQMEREIHDLKTASKKSPVIKTFWLSYMTQGRSDITITYADGPQPIITNVYSWSTVELGPVVDNKQIIFYSGYTDTYVWVASTRPILSITQ